jgi:type II secretory pathway pseudopilin PulG
MRSLKQNEKRVLILGAERPVSSCDGFSLIELLVSMLLTVMILGIAVATFSSALSTRERESSKTDAITSAQAALNIMSREIGNSGYGLTNNGLVFGGANDSNGKRIHFRTNTDNNNYETNTAGEDVTFFYDDASQSVVKYDRYAATPISGIINRVSDVDFIYYDYAANGTVTSSTTTPSANTGRVQIILTVRLPDVRAQPSNQTVTVKTDVTLRNSTYMQGQY